MDADSLLRHAYETAARDIVATSGIWRDGVMVTGEKLSQHDRLVDAAYTISAARRELVGEYRDFMEAYYTPPVAQWREAKELAVKMLSATLADHHRGDRWHICDITRKYCGIKPHHDFDWWQKHNGESERTIRRRTAQVCHNLDDIYQRMIAIVSGLHFGR